MGLDTQIAGVSHERPAVRDIVKMVVALFKLRIVLLLLAAAMAGAFLGAGGIPSVRVLLVIAITGTLAAGGASAINQYLERETDRQMRRTQRRPLPAGRVENPGPVLWIAVAMIVTAVVSVLPSNPAMALYLGLGAVIYIGIYTVWLKPRSVLNIVIGGAAGSMAVMTGGAAVGAASDPGVIVLALLVFLWTPAHFWALAMFYRDDYAAAGVPMLPVRASNRQSARWILVHTLSTGLAAIMLAALPALSWIYFVPAAAITVMMLTASVRLVRQPERRSAIRLFVLSNLFLLLILAAIMVATTGNQLLSA